MRVDGLPDNAPYNEDGYSVPMKYFKYDPDWRRLVREFQEDLGAGRYEPEWLEQAAKAMEERARGDFDKFKDDEFEEFWGQKQKTPCKELAGESSSIKLEELVENGVIREGDILSYSRAICKGENRILIEKDAKVAKVEGNVLTMAIPPGRLKYARQLPTPQSSPTKSAEPSNICPEPESGKAIGGEVNGKADVPAGMVDNGKAAGHETKTENNPAEGPPAIYDKELGPRLDAEELQDTSTLDQSRDPPDDVIKAHTKASDFTTSSSALTNGPSTPTHPPPQVCPPSSPPPSAPSSSQASIEDVIHYRLRTLSEFETRLIETDGRVNPKNHRNPNSWKAIRGKRNNQDLGSLFDMREEYYVWKSPKIVKTPQKKSRSGREAPTRKRG